MHVDGVDVAQLQPRIVSQLEREERIPVIRAK
jgi:hypothetical protein